MATNPDDIRKALELTKLLGGSGGNLRLPSQMGGQGGGGGGGGGDWNQNGQRYLADAAAQKKALDDGTDWDKFWRPVAGLLNVLTAGGSGVMNAIDKGVAGAAEGSGPDGMNQIGATLGGVGGAAKGLVDGFNASIASDDRSENYMTGSKLIESVTDRAGTHQRDVLGTAGYMDKEDNVNPWVKGIGGFALDVGLDPLTYLPGGVIASGVRGASRAAKAAPTGTSSLIAGLKGVKTGDQSFKLGSHSGRVKPVGFDQWKQTRDFDKFERIAQKGAVGSEDLFTAVRTPDEIPRLADELDMDVDTLVDLAARATPHAENARHIWDGTLDMRGEFQATRGARGRRAGERGAAEYMFDKDGNPRGAASADEAAVAPVSASATAGKAHQPPVAEATPLGQGRTPRLDELKGVKLTLPAELAGGKARTLHPKTIIELLDRPWTGRYKDDENAHATAEWIKEQLATTGRQSDTPTPRQEPDPNDPLAREYLDEVATPEAAVGQATRDKQQVQHAAEQKAARAKANEVAARIDTARTTTGGRLAAADELEYITYGPQAVRANEAVSGAYADAANVSADLRQLLTGLKYRERVPGETGGRALGPEIIHKTKTFRPGDLIKQLSEPHPNSKRVWDQDQLTAVANRLGRDPQQISTTDFLRTKGVKQYTRLTQAEKANTKAVSARTMFNGDEIDTVAKTIDPAEAIVAYSATADAALAELGNEALQEGVRGAAARGLVAAVKRLSPKTADGPQSAKHTTPNWRPLEGDDVENLDYVYTHTHQQESILTGLQVIRREAREAFPGDIHAQWKFFDAASKQMRKLETKSGVISVTTFGRGGGGIYKPSVDQDFDWAFLRLDDVTDTLGEDLSRNLLFTHTVKDSRGKDLSFPPTTLQTSALMAMKLAKTPGLSRGERLHRLVEFIADEVDNIPYFKSYGARTNLTSQALINQLAVKLMGRTAQQKLWSAHNHWGAVGVAVAGKNADRITEPIKARLDSVVTALTSSPGDKINAFGKAVTDLRRALTKAGLKNDQLDARIAKADLEAFTAERLDPASAFAVREATRMRTATVIDSAGKPLPDETMHAIQDATVEATRKAQGTPGTPPKNPPAAKNTVSRQRTTEKARKDANRERADGAGSIHANAVEITLQDAAATAARNIDPNVRTTVNPASEAAANLDALLAQNAINLRELVVHSRGAKAARFWSGGAGKRDLKATEVHRSVTMQNSIGNYEKALEKLAADIGGTDMNAWFKAFQKANSSDDVAKFLAQLPAEKQELAGAFWDMAKVIFDHSDSNLFARAGLDSNWINRFVALSPIGGQAGFYLNKNMLGWEVAKVWKTFKIGGDVDGGELDALTLLKSYNWALHNAALIPNIAADLSHQFGHARAFDMSTEQALKAGFIRIDTGKDAGKLARFLDPDQLYPKQIADQFANMEVFLEYNLKLGTDSLSKIVRASDKVVTALKSSITLWRPGHHVVNIMGEALMNQLAGVTNPQRYAQAWGILRAGGDFHAGTTVGHNYKLPIDDFARDYNVIDEAGEVAAGGLPVRIGGKQRRLSYAYLYELLDQGGLLINHNTAEDLLVQGDEIFKSAGKLEAAFAPLIRGNRALGHFSARRDNVFRVAHAVDILQKKSFRTIDDALDYMRREVYEYHPTMQTLSGAEQKIVRRVLYFYTWQRQALTKVLESLVQNPGAVTVAPKGVYEASTIGGDPQSIGQPMPNDQRLPQFANQNILGPHWYDENGDIQGFTINAPQLDILQSFFGAMEFNPDASLAENIDGPLGMMIRQNTIGMLTPAIKAPMELAMETEHTGTYAAPIEDRGEYLLDQTGLGYLSRATGRGFINNDGLFGQRTDVKDTPEEQQLNQERTIKNWLGGLRYQTWSSWEERAKRERDDEDRRMMESLGRNILGNKQPPPPPQVFAG